MRAAASRSGVARLRLRPTSEVDCDTQLGEAVSVVMTPRVRAALLGLADSIEKSTGSVGLSTAECTAGEVLSVQWYMGRYRSQQPTHRMSRAARAEDLRKWVAQQAAASAN